MKKITIAGIVTLIIILSSGTIYIQSKGNRTGCWRGWEYISDGELEGNYKCVSKSKVRVEVCFDVYNSSNTENYWCEKGFRIDPPKELSTQTRTHSRTERCTPKGCESL